ncbi:MAG: undecaprenyldiphospho-muramoylpentapeptide beta-N-acetylglucosaminyltransferase [Firmicutes bacterium]|nr:undecaprenyldiphospho-muramoylpentapeptide beta-N-acetylglucosaminyltransferase [Bacillota bacterium]
MQITITGGGTGGHIYPAIAVASEIRKRYGDAEVSFIGTEKGIESKSVPAAGFSIDFVNAAAISAHPVKLLKSLLINNSGASKAKKLLADNKTKLVIGSGGFVSAPVLAAAVMKGIPVVLLEQNVLPGKVNRLVSHWAKKILTSFEGSSQYLPSEKVVLTGNPIRREIMDRTKEEGLKALKLAPGKFTIAITGASQGARSINNAVIKALPRWMNNDWQIIHLTGRNNYEEVKSAVEPIQGDFTGEYRLIDFTEDIASVYAVADLIISRAGASSLAEITARGIPAILIPYPHAADNHQEKNARWIEKCGGARVIPDKNLEPGELLCHEAIDMAKDRDKLRHMSEAIKTQGKPEALDTIMKELEPFIK